MDSSSTKTESTILVHTNDCELDYKSRKDVELLFWLSLSIRALTDVVSPHTLHSMTVCTRLFTLICLAVFIAKSSTVVVVRELETHSTIG